MSTLGRLRIIPLSGYVVVLPSEGEEKTESGIILPDSSREKPAEGTVLKVGDPVLKGDVLQYAPVKEGDKVVFKKWGSDEVKIDNVNYKLVKFEDLIAIIEE